MAGESALERFRAETGVPGKPPRPRVVRPPVPARQKLIVAGALSWFAITLFWFRGGLDLTGHVVSAGFGVLTFLFLFFPRARHSDGVEGTPGAHLRRLLAFPVFWFGLLVLLYCGVQTINYAWELEYIPGKGGRMVAVPHLEWLPSGVRIPPSFTNSPRAGILQLALPWLMVCTLVTGLRSRRALDWLLNGAIAILALWTTMALGYYYTGADSIYWGIDMGRNNTPPFWGTIKDPNHGAILQVLGLVLCLCLAGRGFRRSLAASRLGGVQIFYLTLALFFSLATLQSLSRAGILLVALIWLVALFGGAWIAYRERSMVLVSILAGFFVLVFGVGILVVSLNLSEQGKRNPFAATIRGTVKQVEDFQEGDLVDRRQLLNRVSLRLFKTSPVYGYGVGSWAYFYRRQADPIADRELLVAFTRWAKDENGKRLLDGAGKPYRVAVPMHFDHAHNEFLQYVCELGVIGSVGVLLLLLWIPGALLVGGRQMGFLGLCALVATTVILLHSSIEFPTRTPALGLLFALCLAAGYVEWGMRRRDRLTAEGQAA